MYDKSVLDGKLERPVRNGEVGIHTGVGQNSRFPRTDAPLDDRLGAARCQRRDKEFCVALEYSGEFGVLWK